MKTKEVLYFCNKVYFYCDHTKCDFTFRGLQFACTWVIKKNRYNDKRQRWLLVVHNPLPVTRRELKFKIHIWSTNWTKEERRKKNLQIKLAHNNVRSYCNKFDMTFKSISDKKFDILCIPETWLK